MRLLTIAIFAAFAACAGSQPAPPQEPVAVAPAPAGSVPGAVARPAQPHPGDFATTPECEKLVDHIDAIYFLSGHERRSFEAPNQDPEWHQSRVRECTISVSPTDRDCLFGSQDVATASHCESRFFADTIQAYRLR